MTARRRTVSRDGVHVRPDRRTGVRVVWPPPARPSRSVGDDEWVTSDLRFGHVIASLCSACRNLALDRCWHCGGLTERADGLCADCAAGANAP